MSRSNCRLSGICEASELLEERQEIIIKDIDKTTIIDCLPVNPQDEEE